MSWTISVVVTLLGVFLPQASSTVGGCPKEFPIGYLSSCFFFSTNQTKWSEAQEHCFRRGGKLAEPKNAGVSMFLRDHAKSLGYATGYILGGIHDVIVKDQWVWASDNSSIDFTDWADGEPNFAHLGLDCLTLIGVADYKWDNYFCGVKFSFICERTGASSASCASSFPIGFQSSCFGIIDEEMTWTDAQAKCGSLGGKLAEPRNLEVNAFLRNYLKNLTEQRYFIGGTDQAREGHWVWDSDNSEMTFTDWWHGYPNSEHCLDMFISSGYKWNDYSCDLEMNFICEKTSSPPPETSSPGETSHPDPTPEPKVTWIIVGVVGGVVLVGCIMIASVVIRKKKNGRNNERLVPSQQAPDTEIVLRESEARAAYSGLDFTNSIDSHTYTEIDHRLVPRKFPRSHFRLQLQLSLVTTLWTERKLAVAIKHMDPGRSVV